MSQWITQIANVTFHILNGSHVRDPGLIAGSPSAQSGQFAGS
jgi:hypothetical protein